MIFSEYLEGESNNKALELYNPTASAISLGGYEIRLSSNGVLAADGGVTSTLAFQSDAGSLGPGATLVVCNAQFATDAGVHCAVFSGVAAFNGDDTVVLAQGTSVIDSIGDGTRPGAGYWGDTTTNTLNHDLRRACDASGRVDVLAPFDPAGAGWTAYVDTDFSDLGVHVCP